MKFDLHEFYKNIVGLNDSEAIEQLISASTIIKVKKKQNLYEAGQKNSYISFLVYGTLRAFLLKADGKEMTNMFYHIPGEIIYVNNMKSPYSLNMMTVQALTDTMVIQVPWTEIAPILESSIDMNHILIDNLGRTIGRQMTTRHLLSYSASERVIWFKEHYPDLIDQKIHDHYIASYLNITPSTFSREKNRLIETLNSD